MFGGLFNSLFLGLYRYTPHKYKLHHKSYVTHSYEWSLQIARIRMAGGISWELVVNNLDRKWCWKMKKVQNVHENVPGERFTRTLLKLGPAWTPKLSKVVNYWKIPIWKFKRHRWNPRLDPPQRCFFENPSENALSESFRNLKMFHTLRIFGHNLWVEVCKYEKFVRWRNLWIEKIQQLKARGERRNFY